MTCLRVIIQNQQRGSPLLVYNISLQNKSVTHFPDLRCLLRAPLLSSHLLAVVRPPGACPIAARRHTHRTNRTHGIGVLHGGIGVGEVLRGLLPVPAQEVREKLHMKMCIQSGKKVTIFKIPVEIQVRKKSLSYSNT